MTITDLEARRTAILQAITKIENGAQEYRIGTRTVQRADLATLYAEYRTISGEIEQLSRPSVTVAFLKRRR